jgi:hypothetical protein
MCFETFKYNSPLKIRDHILQQYIKLATVDSLQELGGDI